ncbi:MAG: winged helix-turn-helix domain-containing protein [Thermoplasmata archaeon]|nr:winged helix-turn-helix domain-containing protein [Thermoplasmata archaeon]
MDAFERIRLILDDQSADILKLTAKKPMTASQIGSELHIPHSVCYRKLKTLIDAQLLNEISRGAQSSYSTNYSKKYVSNIEQMSVILGMGGLSCILKLKSSEIPQTFRIYG